MNASEYALQEAAGSSRPREARIAGTIIGDSRRYHEWELRHADLLRPVASQKATKLQLLAIRNANVQLIHRTAFFHYLQSKPPDPEHRRLLFRLFHASLDLDSAILLEHRHYMLAFSSGISAGHLVDIMQDEVGFRLMRRYEQAYGRYFEIKCFLASARESLTRDLVMETLRDAQVRLIGLRRLLETEFAVDTRSNFDELELLSRSGRYEIQNYLIA